MLLTRGIGLLKAAKISKLILDNSVKNRMAMTSPSGSILPEPKKPRFGYVGVICAVSTGLFIGATLSKNIANFLEENELFIPTDDDDDD